MRVRPLRMAWPSPRMLTWRVYENVQLPISSRIPVSSLSLPRSLNLVFEFVAQVEMVFDGALAPAGDEAHVGEPRFHRFLHPVLHEGLGEDRQHFLGHGLGGRQKPGSIPGDGKQALLDHRFQRRRLEPVDITLYR